MTSKERIILALKHEEADMVAIHDNIWNTTRIRWIEEGLSKDITPSQFFNFEIECFSADGSMQLPTKIIEDTEEYFIERNPEGALVKHWKNIVSTPGYIDFLIKDRKIWEEYKIRLFPNENRVEWEKEKNRYNEARKNCKFICYSGAIGYDQTQNLVGTERLMIAMVEESEWVIDMFKVNIDLHLIMFEEMVNRGFEFDGAFVYDDLGYRNGTLFSKEMYRELIYPYHKRICDFYKVRNIPVILHSCGCVKDLIPYFIEVGFTCLQPLEVKAGMDLIELKKNYGDKLAFMGGIDTRKMNNPDPEIIEEEIKTKITFAKKGGGYIYHSDHSIPDTVSFKDYSRVIELIHKYGSYL